MGVNTRADLMEVERAGARGAHPSEHARAGRDLPRTRRRSPSRGGRRDRRGHHDRPGAPCCGADRDRRRLPRSGPAPPSTTRRSATASRVLHSYLTRREVHDERDASARSPTCARRPTSARARRSARSSRSRTRTSAPARRSPTSPTSATPTSARAPTSPPGNITANYDGREKHRTKIGKRREDRASTPPSSLPSPSGTGAYTGAGSVIAEDVPDGALGISRPEQKNIEGYCGARRGRSSHEHASRPTGSRSNGQQPSRPATTSG